MQQPPLRHHRNTIVNDAPFSTSANEPPPVDLPPSPTKPTPTPPGSATLNLPHSPPTEPKYQLATHKTSYHSRTMFGTPVTLHHYPGLPLDVFSDFVPSAAMWREHHHAALIGAAGPGGWYIPAHLARLPGYSPMPGVYVEFRRDWHGVYDSDREPTSEDSSCSSDYEEEDDDDEDSDFDSDASTLVNSVTTSPAPFHHGPTITSLFSDLRDLLRHKVLRAETEEDFARCRERSARLERMLREQFDAVARQEPESSRSAASRSSAQVPAQVPLPIPTASETASALVASPSSPASLSTATESAATHSPSGSVATSSSAESKATEKADDDHEHSDGASVISLSDGSHYWSD